MLMDASIEAELRFLVRHISKRAAQGGGLDGQTYDALREASAALSSKPPTGESEGREEALHAMRARLRACEAGLHVKAA
jgi:hypothetical protein